MHVIYLNQLGYRSDHRRAEVAGLEKQNLHYFNTEKPDLDQENKPELNG